MESWEGVRGKFINGSCYDNEFVYTMLYFTVMVSPSGNKAHEF